ATKAGVGHASGPAKLARLVAHFTELHQHVPYLQANFLFGLDGDGDDSVALTKEFMTWTPFVWPVINIPYPFGGTPLFHRCLDEGRTLTATPFSFYYSPSLVTTLRDATPIAFYRRLIDLFAHFTAPGMLMRRLATTSSRFARLTHLVRTAVKRRRLAAFR